MSLTTIGKCQSQLFLDDEAVAEMRNVTLEWRELRKHPKNPLILCSGPETSVVMFGSVLREQMGGESVFRMWYYASASDGTSPWIGYAISSDGIHWEKPKLGIVEIGGGRANNAVFRPPEWRLIGFSGVVRDPNPGVPDGERYKLTADAQHWEEKFKAYVTATSPDGIHWTLLDHFIPARPSNPDRSCLVWDPFAKRYSLYHRAKHVPQELVNRGGPAYWGRAVALCTSEDFRTWSEPVMVMTADEGDADGTEIYGIGAFPYEGQWVGLPQIHRSLPELAFIDVAIAHSRDGVRWRRERKLVLSCGGIGEWDRFNQVTATAPVRVEDELWVYYCGRTYRHGEYKSTGLTDSGPHHLAIGLATLRLDGWRSVGASFDGGYLTTKPLILPEGKLFVNAQADWGEVTVAVLDENGTPMPGLSSRPVKADGVHLPVEWAAELPFESVAGKRVRLRFTLKNALLYSWQVA